MNALEQLDATFSALSDPTRRAILARLAAGEVASSDMSGAILTARKWGCMGSIARLFRPSVSSTRSPLILGVSLNQENRSRSPRSARTKVKRHSEALCFIPRERPAMPQLPPAWSTALPLATTGSQSCPHPLGRREKGDLGDLQDIRRHCVSPGCTHLCCPKGQYDRFL